MPAPRSKPASDLGIPSGRPSPSAWSRCRLRLWELMATLVFTAELAALLIMAVQDYTSRRQRGTLREYPLVPTPCALATLREYPLVPLVPRPPSESTR